MIKTARTRNIIYLLFYFVIIISYTNLFYLLIKNNSNQLLRNIIFVAIVVPAVITCFCYYNYIKTNFRLPVFILFIIVLPAAQKIINGNNSIITSYAKEDFSIIVINCIVAMISLIIYLLIQGKLAEDTTKLEKTDYILWHMFLVHRRKITQVLLTMVFGSTYILLLLY